MNIGSGFIGNSVNSVNSLNFVGENYVCLLVDFIIESCHTCEDSSEAFVMSCDTLHIILAVSYFGAKIRFL